MFSFRGPIILPALVAAALLTAVMLWQRVTHDSPLQNAEIPISAVDAPSARPLSAPVAAVPAAQPAPVKALAVPANDAAALNAADSEQMPVQIVFRRRERLNKFEGRITNTSGDPLQIEVLVSSASTHYTTQAGVNVGGYLQSSFGIDDGLDMQSGDQVTLRSYPYHDSVIQIP